MKPMKTKIAILLLGVLLVGVSGCKKCYECSVLVANIRCNNGVDTMSLIEAHRKYIDERMNELANAGYINCDTFQFIWQSGQHDLVHNPVCSKTYYKELTSLGDECR